MSTKIYNGIKFKSNNFKEVLDQLILLKKPALDLLEIKDLDIEYIILKNNLIDKDHFTIWDFMNNSVEFLSYYIFKVIIFPTTEGDIYGYCFNSKYLGLLDDISDEFSYYDNTDHPEDIDYADWDWRGMKWDEILKSYHIKDNGFSYDIIGSNDLDARTFRKRIKEVLEVMKRDNKINSILGN